MGKPGKIFDFNSPWGCLGCSAWVFVLGTFVVYFSIVRLLPFTEYICDYRCNFAPMGEPVKAYPVNFIENIADFDSPIDSLPYRAQLKGHIIKRDGDVVTLKVNAYRLYEYQGVGGIMEGDLRTIEFQEVNKEFEMRIPTKEASPVFDENGMFYMFIQIAILFGLAWPIASYLMKKVNDVSQNSVRYLADTNTNYSPSDDSGEKKTGGFTKKS